MKKKNIDPSFFARIIWIKRVLCTYFIPISGVRREKEIEEITIKNLLCEMQCTIVWDRILFPFSKLANLNGTGNSAYKEEKYWIPSQITKREFGFFLFVF